MKKLISSVLVLATLVACLAVLPFGSFARVSNGDVVEELKPVNTNKLVEPYLTQSYYSAQDKLDRDSENMQLWATYGTKELYASSLTGEVYVKDVLTGNILNSNPYDTSPVISSSVRKEVMSQLILNYRKAGSSVTNSNVLLSYTESAERGQITIEPILNGIRVNYAIGDTTKRYLLPYGIMATEMIEILYEPMHVQLEGEFREAAENCGVPEEYIQKYFDFKSYCEKNVSVFSTAKSLGVEYTYGNINAFEKWLNEIDRFYRAYYNYTDYEVREQGDDPQNKRPASEQANMITPREMNAIASEYNQINQAYSFVTPYLEYKGDDPDNWILRSEAVQQLYPILTEDKVAHPIYGKDYYCNAIFVLDYDSAAKILRNWETLFGKFVDGYTLSRAEAAEDETHISPPANENPVFYMSLLYELTDDGFTVELPSTSIMYDESEYTINSIRVLPYMGSGNVYEDGFLFYPDGSGAVIEFEDYRTDKSSLSGKIYGYDYSYYSITGQHQKSISMPVYGTVRAEDMYEMRIPYKDENGEYLWVPCTYQQYTDKTYTITYKKTDTGISAVLPFGQEIPLEKRAKANETDNDTYTAWVLDADGRYYTELPLCMNATDAIGTHFESESAVTVVRAKDFRILEENTSTTGYFAIIEEGASLTTIHAALDPLAQYTMSMLGTSFMPRCEDSYNLSDSVSSITDANASFSVLSDDKFMGSYTTRYIMLTDDEDAQRASFVAAAMGLQEIPTYYSPTYAGMAQVYRNYLLENDLLPETVDAKSQLPLVIESFGVIQTTEKYLSIPFTVDAALTTFKQIETMYEGLDIDNIKFRLTGFANGGMFPTYPAKISWESAAGGEDGFEDLLVYASKYADLGLEIFPNFNFLYVLNTGWFDGIDIKDICVRSVDNRYAMRKTYSSVYQTYTFSTTDGILVAANMLDELYGEFYDDYQDYAVGNLSLASMASDLSGDFNEDNTLTRDEAMKSIIGVLETANKNYSLMSDGGNMYALKYMTYLLDAPIDSSHFRSASRTVPFWGMVVHGHIEYTGGAFNEESNKREALLRAIESGASLYFLLSYENTRLMKEDLFLSDYYSVDYKISIDTVTDYYNQLNEVIGDLQTYHLVDHRVVYAERVGLASDKAEQLQELEDEFLVALVNEIEAQKETLRLMSLALKNLGVNVNNALITSDVNGDGILTGDEVTSEWSRPLDCKPALKTFVSTYQTVPMIAEIIGNVNLDIDDNDLREDAVTAASKALYFAIINGKLSLDYGSTTIGVAFNDTAVLETARVHLGVDKLEDDFIADIRRVMSENTVVVNGKHLNAEIGAFTYTPAHSYFTTSSCLDQDYKLTESTVSDGTVVMVTYSNGTDEVSIVLNFNIFAVNLRLDGKLLSEPLGKYDYKRINK